MYSKMYIGLHVKCRLFLSDFKEMSLFLTDFRKIMKHKIPLKIRAVGVELLRADRRTEIAKLVVSFRNFAKAP